ncbi:MAG TPA: M61 family peptidase [Gammaproteobacteria bacterium]|nr:M61 family peptidase [Gammaproteobacteria bacterium]
MNTRAWLFLLPALAGSLPDSAAASATIHLNVDLTDAPRQLFHVHETLAVVPGPLTLNYPKWVPGEHSPSGPLENLAGLKFSAGGKPLAWRRDLEDMYAVHLDVPTGVDALDADFDFLSPMYGGVYGQSVSATPDLADLEWNQVLLYPAGKASQDIVFEASVTLPVDWNYATALEPGAHAKGATGFKPVSLDELVDSPLIAGRYFRRVDLVPGGGVPVHLDVVADAAADLDISAEQTDRFRSLVTQAYALFGAHHYDHYDFLLTLSDNTGHFGLEHHQSSDDRTWQDYFTEPGTMLVGNHLMPHEYVHSWNGKFRRPAGLWTADFNSTPMQGDLLWVYEGLTEYFGDVLAARSGLWTPEQYRELLAMTAARMDNRPGRTWRPLQDTADEAQILYYAPREWENWRRVQDFYAEGELLWLDVDTKLRELSGGRRSLNDFARAFYGMDDGSHAVKTYVFDDVVATLNQVQAFDWAGFLHARLDTTQYHAPLDGISRGGYRLAYSDTPSEFFKADEKRRMTMNMMYSIGLLLSTENSSAGTIKDVLWGSPAFKAGVGPGMKLIAVDGRDFSAADKTTLKNAIIAARTSKEPIKLLVRNQDDYISFDVDYHDGLKYPVLQPIAGVAPVLDAITAPLK